MSKYKEGVCINFEPMISSVTCKCGNYYLQTCVLSRASQMVILAYNDAKLLY
jgi:hypothetical protein